MKNSISIYLFYASSTWMIKITNFSFLFCRADQQFHWIECTLDFGINVQCWVLKKLRKSILHTIIFVIRVKIIEKNLFQNISFSFLYSWQHFKRFIQLKYSIYSNSQLNTVYFIEIFYEFIDFIFVRFFETRDTKYIIRSVNVLHCHQKKIQFNQWNKKWKQKNK